MDLLRGFFGLYAGLLTYLYAFLRPLLPLVSPSHQPTEITLNGRRLKVLKQLGEGGYSYVWLCRQVPTTQPDTSYAVKKINASTSDQVAAAQREIGIQSQLPPHPALLPLLDSAIISASPQPGHTSEGDSSSSPHTVYMLFPAFPDGSLADELARLEQARAKAAGTGGAGKGAVTMTVPPTGHPGGVVLPTSEVLSIFRQVASGLAAMHEAGYAHRDVKPHNVLIRRPQPGGSRPGAGQLGHHPALPAATASIQAGTIVDAAQEAQLAASQALLPQQPQQPQHQQQQQQQHSAGSLLQVAGRALGAVQSVHSTALGKPRPLQLGAYQALPISEQQDGEGTSAGYTAVLMDFGSARARAVNVVNRSQALLLQEEAEAHMTATFRPPEWFDVPSPAQLDAGAADVWAAGCTLYALMYGQSPFQLAINQAGSSLALAVLNCAVPWPKTPDWSYPSQLHDLVLQCLAQDPAARPTAAQLCHTAQELAAAGLPDPPALAKEQEADAGHVAVNMQ